jgi:hypothetical protein
MPLARMRSSAATGLPPNSFPERPVEFIVGDVVRILECPSEALVGLRGTITRIDQSQIPYQIDLDRSGSTWCSKVELIVAKCSCDFVMVVLITGCKCGAMDREKTKE